LRYRAGLPLILCDLNFTINPGEKIGIVGRTGAGKSTIISSILRLIEPTSGKILLDGQSIVDVPLRDLRCNVTLILQEPNLIEGTLRENLDPRAEHSDAILFEAMKKCCIYSIFGER
jgi:ABC-type multidrug transport system fused ATPase/permease subunit